MVVAGTTLVGPFDSSQSKPVLRVGGHQQRIRIGLPRFEGGVKKLMPSDMDGNPVIPGLTILYRLLPHTEVRTAAYTECNAAMHRCNVAERRL